MAGSACIAVPRHAGASADVCAACFPTRVSTAGGAANAPSTPLAFCVHCGERSAGGAYCGRCGASLARRTVPARPAAPAVGYAAAPSRGYAPAPEWETSRPGQVTAAAVLMFVLAGFSLVAAMLVLGLGSFGGGFALLGVVLLAVGGLEVWTGVGLLQLRGWARVLGITLASLGGLLSVVSIVAGSPASVLGLAIYVTVGVLLSGRAASEAL